MVPAGTPPEVVATLRQGAEDYQKVGALLRQLIKK